jgi:hypothetical protein
MTDFTEQKYGSIIDTFFFAKYDVINDDECQQIIELNNSPLKLYDNLCVRNAVSTFYRCGNNKKNFIYNPNESNSLLARFDLLVRDTDKHENEIIRMDKTPEEACVWVTHFIFKKQFATAQKIRNQIPFPKYHNRILFRSDLLMEVADLIDAEDEPIRLIEKITTNFEEMLMADPFIKFIDDDVSQKVKEIFIMHFNSARCCYVSIYPKTSKVTNAITSHIVSYHNFTCRNEEDDDSIKANISLFRGDHGAYLIRQKKKLLTDRLRVSMSDIIYICCKTIKSESDFFELLTIIRENLDIIVASTKYANGCTTLNILINIYKHPKLNFAEKILMQRVGALTSGNIIDTVAPKFQSALKFYSPEMKTEECPICFENNKPYQTLVVECRNCRLVVCLDCIVKARNNGINKCSICRSVVSTIKIINILSLIKDFKYDIQGMHRH